MLIIVGLVFAALAALLHVFIFYLESIAWTGPQARKTFGTTADEADALKEMAFNQGFYNLFLAILVAIGIVLYGVGHPPVGVTLSIAGAGSMAAASVVLLLSSRDKASAAVKQGTLPIVAVILLVVGLVV